MRRHWQKRPLLVRRALAVQDAPIDRAALFELAAHDDVESRLVAQTPAGWRLRHGPFPRRSLPPLRRPGWTLLVQGVDLHVQAAHDLLARFRFIPDARLDDLMVSWASDGGGVGPHFDSYDVFLLQVHGARRWRVGRQRDLTLQADVPLKILQRFEPEAEWLLEPGDMLYLPPRWAHDGVAEGECMTCSIGFRASGRTALARDLLQWALDRFEAPDTDSLYADPSQPATGEPGRIPSALEDFAVDAVRRLVADRSLLDGALGELLSEPKAGVAFEPGEPWQAGAGVALDRRSRMMYNDRHVFLNGESFRASGRDATLMRRLADARRLAPEDVARLSEGARQLLDEWLGAGWLRHDAARGDSGSTE